MLGTVKGTIINMANFVGLLKSRENVKHWPVSNKKIHKIINSKYGNDLTIDQRNEAIIYLTQAKLSYTQIGEILGLSNKSVSRIALQLGIRQRTAPKTAKR